jgi:hypothetical protein
MRSVLSTTRITASVSWKYDVHDMRSACWPPRSQHCAAYSVEGVSVRVATDDGAE